MKNPLKKLGEIFGDLNPQPARGSKEIVRQVRARSRDQEFGRAPRAEIPDPRLHLPRV